MISNSSLYISFKQQALEVADQEGLCPFDKTIEGLETLMGKDLEDLSCN